MTNLLLKPHRVVLIALCVAIVAYCILALNWSWLADPQYQMLIVKGVWWAIWLTVLTMGVGMLLALPMGLAQAAGPWYFSWPSRIFCTVIRGTPLLMQIWLIYYGVGSLFPSVPWIRDSSLWPILRQGWPYAVLALTLTAAGYEAEVMRGAFRSVPHGQLEAAKAMGMPRFSIFYRIWMPQALRRALTTIGGDTVLQLKATPLVSTITIMELYGAIRKIRSDTLIIYEPLLLLAVIYMAMTGVIVMFFRWLERQTPVRLA